MAVGGVSSLGLRAVEEFRASGLEGFRRIRVKFKRGVGCNVSG